MKILAFGIVALIISMKTCECEWLNKWLWGSPKSICYKRYGCFTTEPPFTNTKGMLPDKPKKMGVKFLLYTRRPTRRQKLAIMKLKADAINITGDVKFIIHGYKDRARNKWVKKMARALLKKDDMTVVAVDWKKGANTLNYLQAVANCRLVGNMVGKFVQKLQHRGLDIGRLHLIGHSLGAHISGYVGKMVKGISRISGLDPAGPGFDGTHSDVKLDPTDALFVDVIHTDTEQLINLNIKPGFGTNENLGSVDFYPNSGMNQPGCAMTFNQQIQRIFNGDLDVVENFGCSHLRAFRLFTASISGKCEFMSFPCHSGVQVAPGCDSCGENGCARMGYYAHEGNPRGVFVLNTTGVVPYCAT